MNDPRDAELRVFRSRKVYTPDGPRAASVHVRHGQIERVSEYDDVPQGAPMLDAGNASWIPGVVDTHVHVNEPGRTPWEGFATATRSAAAGGITTIVDMPLNSIPPTTSPAGVAAKVSAIDTQCHVDVGLWGGAVPANTTGDAKGLDSVLREGALGFKCFLLPSGVDEFPYASEADVRAALTQLRGTGVALMVHAELAGPIDTATRLMRNDPANPPDPRDYRNYVRSRPREAEDLAVELLYGLAREYQTPIHVVHLSSSGALATMERARQEGVLLTAETAPHYLHFAAEEIPDGATWYKCAPPIRERENRERLWAALGDGLISMVVSDHSPCTPDLKRTDAGDFDAAWGGIAGVQFSLSAVWTEASARGFALERVVEWMCAAPARHAALPRKKGAIAPGYDADLVLFDDAATFQVTDALVQHKNKLTPYAGQSLRGLVRATYVRGQCVYDAGAFASSPRGQWLAGARP